MTVTGGTICAFSAVKANNGPSLKNQNEETETSQIPMSNPILLQVSMVTTAAVPMSPAAFENAMEHLRNAKDAIKGSYNGVKSFYDKHEKTFKKVGRGLKALQGIGDIVQGIKKLGPEEEDPMVKSLGELENDVKELGDQLSEHFDEMKLFISEQASHTNIVTPTLMLTEHMSDCLKFPGDDSKKNFERAYNNNRPLALQYYLSSYLDHKTTNPLKLSMEKEKGKTNETFEKWENIICQVVIQFMFLEAFANGLLDSKNTINQDRLMTEANETFKGIYLMKEEDHKDYWEDFKTFLVPYIEENTHLNNAQKANGIRDKLATYWTRDAFYVFVFNKTTWQQDYTYYCPDEDNKIFGAWHKGGCCAFVYRSFTGGKLDGHEYGQLKGRMMICATKMHWDKIPMENVIKERAFEYLTPDYGFYCMMENDYRTAIRFVNQPKDRKMGPGYYSEWIHRTGNKEYTLLAAFK